MRTPPEARLDRRGEPNGVDCCLLRNRKSVDMMLQGRAVRATQASDPKHLLLVIWSFGSTLPSGWSRPCALEACASSSLHAEEQGQSFVASRLRISPCNPD